MKTVLGVVFGYVAMFIVVFTSLSLAYLAMGTDSAYQPGSYEVSMVWIAVSLALGFVAALIGGLVAAAVARNSTGPKALAILVVVLGLIMAVAIATSSKAQDVGPRTADVSAIEAMQKSITPTWVALLNPIIGAVGVMLGARLVSRRGQG